MVGSLFSSDAWNNVTFAAAEVQNPTRNLPLALAIGTGHGQPALRPRQRRLPQRAALPRRSQRRRRARARHPVRRAGSGRHRGRRGDAWAGAAPCHGDRHHALDLRLQQRADPRRARGCTTRWRGPALLPRAGELHPTFRTPVFGLGAQAVWAMLLCLSGTYSQLLDYVIFAALLFYFLTTAGALPAPGHSARSAAAGEGVRLPGAAGAVHGGGRRFCWSSCWSIGAAQVLRVRAADRGAGHSGLSGVADASAVRRETWDVDVGCAVCEA